MRTQVKTINRSFISAIVISLFLICSPALAVVTWNGVGGDGDTLTSTAANWVGGVAPLAGVADTLVFGTDGAILNQVNVDTAFTALTGINFTLADAAYTITDSGAGDLGFGAAATITNTVAFTHVINSSMTSAGLTFNLANNLTVGGAISGTTITKSTGVATLSLGGNNTYTGATSIDAGTLAVTANNALGTVAGATTVASGATLGISGGINYSTAEGLTISGSGVGGVGAPHNISGDNTFAGTIALGAASTIGSSAGTLTASGTINNAGYLLTVGGAGSETLSGVISGTGALTKADAGTLTLSGINTYSGITTIGAGKVSIGADSGLGTAPGAATATQITFTGGTLESSGTFTLNSVRGITLTGGGTIDVDASKTLTYDGIIAGASTLAKADTGTLSLGGNSTYTGATTISAGTLAVTANNALGTNAAGTTVADGATLGISGGINYSTAEGLTISGSGVGGVGALHNISGDNTFAGTIALGAASTIGSSAGTLTASGTINNAGFLLTTGGAGNETLSGVISGTGALTKAGAGTVTLSGINTYSGITTIGAGKLSIGADSGLGTAPGGATATQITFTGGTLESSGTFALNTNRGITLTGAGTIDVDAGQTLTYNGIIAGASTLAKADTGTLILGGNSTYTGATTISAGTVAVNVNNALGTAAAGTTVADGATLGIYGGINYSTAEGLTLNGAGVGGVGSLHNISGDNTFAGAIVLGAASTVGSTAGTLTASGTINNAGFLLTTGGAGSETLSGVISGAGGLTKTGAGTTTLSGVGNTYTGTTTINAGTLKVSGGTAIANAGAVTLADVAGATFELTNSETIGSLAGGGTTGGNVNLNANTLTVGDATSTTYAGAISGTGALTKAGAGTLTLSGNNSYTGITTLNASTIILGHNSALGTGAGAILTLGGAGTIQSNDNARLVSNKIALAGNALTVSGTNNLALSGVISGAGAGSTLTKTGAGTLTLTGVNTHVGLTTLTAGTLTGAFSLNGAGGLQLDGGTFKPGNSIGTVVVAGNYLQNAGSTLEVEVSNSGGALTSDFLDVTGSATLGAGSTINVLDVSPVGSVIITGDTFNIIEADGGIVNNGPTITDNSAVLSFTGGVSGNFYRLTATRQTFASALGGGSGPLEAIDSDIAGATGDYITLINALTALDTAELGNAEEQLDPLPYGSSTTTSIRATQQMMGNLVNYLSARRSGTERAMMFDYVQTHEQTLVADASNDPRMLAYVINENKEIEKTQEEEADTDSSIKGFFRPFGVFYDHDTTSHMTGFDAKAVGALFGIDRNYGANWIVGIGGGYTRSSIHFKENRGEAETDSFRLGPYVSYSKNNFFVDTSVSLGLHENENKRNIRFPGINRTARSDYSAYDLSAYAGAGYDFHVKDLTVTPTASIQYINYHTEDFRETGAGAAGLDVDATTSESLRSKLGMTLSKVLELHGTKVVPEVFAGWAHEFMNDENLRARFVEGTAKFTTGVDDEWDDSVYFGAGISALLRKNVSAFVRYEGEYSSGNGINALNFGVTILF